MFAATPPKRRFYSRKRVELERMVLKRLSFARLLSGSPLLPSSSSFHIIAPISLSSSLKKWVLTPVVKEGGSRSALRSTQPLLRWKFANFLSIIQELTFLSRRIGEFGAVSSLPSCSGLDQLSGEKEKRPTFLSCCLLFVDSDGFLQKLRLCLYPSFHQERELRKHTLRRFVSKKEEIKTVPLNFPSFYLQFSFKLPSKSPRLLKCRTVALLQKQINYFPPTFSGDEGNFPINALQTRSGIWVKTFNS